MKIVMHESERPLGEGHRENHLRHPRAALLRFRVLLVQFVERAFALLHHRNLDGRVVKDGVRKPLRIFVVLKRFLVGFRRPARGPRPDFKAVIRRTPRVVRTLVVRVFFVLRRKRDILFRRGGSSRYRQRRQVFYSKIHFACVLHLDLVGRLDFQFKKVTNVLREPRAVAQVFVVVRNVDDVLLGNAGKDAVHFGEVRAPALGQQDGRERTHVCRVVCGLKARAPGILAVRQSGPRIVAAHHVVRRVEHGFLQMNLLLHAGRVDAVGRRNGLNSVSRLYAKCVRGAHRLHLEQFLDAGEVGLDAAKTPLRLRLLLQTLEVCLLLDVDRTVCRTEVRNMFGRWRHYVYV